MEKTWDLIGSILSLLIPLSLSVVVGLDSKKKFGNVRWGWVVLCAFVLVQTSYIEPLRQA